MKQSQIRMETELAAASANLRAEPLAAIMYGSLELFHSNLIGWFIEREPDRAQKALGPWLEPGDEKGVRVLREYEHMDLTVTLPGYRRLVIENKVFSVPTSDQLRRQSEHFMAWEAEGKGPTTAILLSVFTPGWRLPEPWVHVGFDDLAQRILAVIPDDGSFESEAMVRWTRIAHSLTSLADAVRVRSPDEHVLPNLDLGQVLDGDTRLTARLLKFRMNSVADHLRGAVQQFKGYVKADFTNGRPLIEWFRDVGTAGADTAGLRVGWQLQGRDFRRAVIVPAALSGRDQESRAQRFAFAAAQDAWFDFGPIDGILGTKGVDVRPKITAAKPDGFNRYDPDFVYRNKPVGNPQIQQLIEATAVIASSISSK